MHGKRKRIKENATTYNNKNYCKLIVYYEYAAK